VRPATRGRGRQPAEPTVVREPVAAAPGRVLTDNAMVYLHGTDWGWVCSAWQLKRRFTKPGRPWTNGKAERFNRTLLTEWAYARPWTSNRSRARALDRFLIHYNTRCGHSALGGHPPITRLAA
jgi:transposase InsO family protein